MKTVNINKTELLNIIKDNLTLHEDKYFEAIDDYHDAVLVICTKNLAIAKAGIIDDYKNIKAIPHKPQSFAADYNTVITMLELSVDTNITITEQDFRQLVLDKWAWKDMFELSNQTYKSLKG